jgi:hypothetical protein
MEMVPVFTNQHAHRFCMYTPECVCVYVCARMCVYQRTYVSMYACIDLCGWLHFRGAVNLVNIPPFSPSLLPRPQRERESLQKGIISPAYGPFLGTTAKKPPLPLPADLRSMRIYSQPPALRQSISPTSSSTPVMPCTGCDVLPPPYAFYLAMTTKDGRLRDASEVFQPPCANTEEHKPVKATKTKRPRRKWVTWELQMNGELVVRS